MKGYFLKSPQAGRKSFAVIGFEVVDGKRKNYTVRDERIVAINQAFQSGVLHFDRAREQAKEIVADLYKKEGSPTQALRRSGLLKDNEKVFGRFWNDVYEGREIIDRISMKADYLRAFRALGTTSILTASKGEIAKAIRTSCPEASKRRRVANRLNTVLKYLKREISIDKPEEDVKEIRFLTLPELKRLLTLEEDPTYRALYATLFAGGFRIGEAMALGPESFLGESIFVGSQLTPTGKRKLPKRGKTGHVLYLPLFEKEVLLWLKVKDKQPYRLNLNRRLAKLTRKLWPKDASKRISVHGFRHSHAIHYLSLGVSLEFVARNLRNRIEVCQKYYAGYAHTSSTLSAMRSFLVKASRA